MYEQCKLCKSWRFHRAVLRRCFRAHCCAPLTGAGEGPDSAENREVSARVLGLGSMPVVVQRKVPDVETVQKTVESPQLVLLLDKVVDVPVLATSWGCRGSAVAVHRLVCQLIMSVISSLVVFLVPCTQAQGQG